MATGGSGLHRTMEAGQDLSSHQYKFVTIASDGQIDPTGAGLAADGVLQDDPAAAGRAGLVMTLGTTKVVAGAAVTRGAKVTSDSTGRAVTATTGNFICGRAITTAGAAGELMEVELIPGGISA